MGFFSYTCAKTGLPVMADAGASTEDLVLCDATLVPRRGKCISGLYDGYGRLDGQEITEQMDKGAKLVLSAFYKGERFTELGPSDYDWDQGCFSNWKLIRAAYDIISGAPDEYLGQPSPEGGFGGKCIREYGAVRGLLRDQLAQAWGVTPLAVEDLLSFWGAGLPAGNALPKGLQGVWEQKVAPLLGNAPENSPFKRLAPLAALEACRATLDLSEQVARDEALAALRERRFARTPLLNALVLGRDLPQAWLGEPALERAQGLDDQGPSQASSATPRPG